LQSTHDLFSRYRGNPVESNYLQNAIQALRNIFEPWIFGGIKLSPPEFIGMLKLIHFYFRGGHNGKLYEGSDGDLGANDLIFGVDIHNSRLEWSDWPYAPNRIAAMWNQSPIRYQHQNIGEGWNRRLVKLEGIPNEALPLHDIKRPNLPNRDWRFYYIQAKWVPTYLTRMSQLMNSVLDEIHGKRNLQKMISDLADYHQLFSIAHPFVRVNNSIALSQVNYVLELLKLNGIAHGELDHWSMYLDSTDYRKMFWNLIASQNPQLPMMDFFTPLQLKIDIHLANRGDRSVVNGDVVVAPNSAIEGFTLKSDDLPKGVILEYQTLAAGVESAWAKQGEYSGSKGKSLALQGFAIRLTGLDAMDYSVRYQVTATGQVGADGSLVGSPTGPALKDIRIWIYKKNQPDFL
jgi:hypothetical protein